MSPRIIQVPISSEDKTCGECHFERERINFEFVCLAYGVLLDNPRFLKGLSVRCRQCLASEVSE